MGWVLILGLKGPIIWSFIFSYLVNINLLPIIIGKIDYFQTKHNIFERKKIHMNPINVGINEMFVYSILGETKDIFLHLLVKIE